MAEQQKDNTMMVVIGVTIIAVVGVLLLKQDEVKHLNAYSSETTAAAEAQVLKTHKDYNNDVLKQAE